jgi:hypothetical protein
MKVFILLLAGMLSAGSAFGQGSVTFANTASFNYRLLTNNGSASGLMTGTNQWRIGLYVGALGTPEDSLVLVGLATNLAPPFLAGYFSGGNPFWLYGPFGVGDPLTFQVRAWAFSGGLTYEEAINSGVLVGKSSLGVVTPPPGLLGPAALFGVGPGQIGAFTIGVPEPSTYALGLLGVALFGLLGRRRR